MSAVLAEVLEPLDTLGTRCRATLTTGHDAIVEAARIAVEARLRIEHRREEYPGGFKAWWDTYCTISPWTAPKLLTAGCWRETKKSGEIPTTEQIAGNVERLKSEQRRDQAKSREQNSLTSEKSVIEPAPRWSHERDMEPKIAAVIKAINRCSLDDRAYLWGYVLPRWFQGYGRIGAGYSGPAASGEATAQGTPDAPVAAPESEHSPLAPPSAAAEAAGQYCTNPRFADRLVTACPYSRCHSEGCRHEPPATLTADPVAGLPLGTPARKPKSAESPALPL